MHQGDGTAEIFHGDDRVFTVSVHGQDNFPFRKKSSDLDIGLAKGAGDEEFLSAIDQAIEQISGESFDLLFFQAGVDALEMDALVCLRFPGRGCVPEMNGYLRGEENWECPCFFLWAVDIPILLNTRWMHLRISFSEQPGNIGKLGTREGDGSFSQSLVLPECSLSFLQVTNV